MRVTGVEYENLLQYKKPSMFISAATCTFKCERESGCHGMCQNSHLAQSPIVTISNEELIIRYISNPITKAIVFGGLEPLDQFAELYAFIEMFRQHADDDIVIYTGYDYQEKTWEVYCLQRFKNIIIKFGRYIPNDKSHMDSVLGVELASSNQYAEVIS